MWTRQVWSTPFLVVQDGMHVGFETVPPAVKGYACSGEHELEQEISEGVLIAARLATPEELEGALTPNGPYSYGGKDCNVCGNPKAGIRTFPINRDLPRPIGTRGTGFPPVNRRRMLATETGYVLKPTAHCSWGPSPGSHNTPHAGPHGAFPSRVKAGPRQPAPKLVTTTDAIEASPVRCTVPPERCDSLRHERNGCELDCSTPESHASRWRRRFERMTSE
jgi:hypothetical protein